MKKTILIVEDTEEYGLIFRSALQADYQLELAINGASALKHLSNSNFDLIVLDLTLPDMDGLQICNFIKNSKEHLATPVIIVSGRDTVDSKVEGLEMGANDYLTKPFDAKELLARVRAQLRSKGENDKAKTIGQIQIDFDRHRVFHNDSGTEIELTGKEFAILGYLSNRIDFVISREQIIEQVWSDNINVSDRTVDSHISNLRKKLSGTQVEIEAVQGSGYRLALKTS